VILRMPRPWKHPKTGIYWFRKEVPAALREKVGKRELKWTLATKNRAAALTKYPGALEQAEQVLSAALNRGVCVGNGPKCSHRCAST